MAQEASQSRLIEPDAEDCEGHMAIRWLENIWKEIKAGELARFTGSDAEKRKLSRRLAKDVKGEGYYHQTLMRIRKDETLVFDGWRLSHGEVSYTKEFADADERSRAQKLLDMINLAGGRISNNVMLPEHDQLSELRPDSELRSLLSQRRKTACRLAVRRDWMEAFAHGERMNIGLGGR